MSGTLFYVACFSIAADAAAAVVSYNEINDIIQLTLLFHKLHNIVCIYMDVSFT
jgi:hypothetical protein